MQNPTEHLQHLLCLNINKCEKALRGDANTAYMHCSKTEPKIFVLPDPLPGGVGRPKFNQVETVTTFT